MPILMHDIRRLIPKTIADKVTELADNFKKASNNTKIIISSLITRSDQPEFASKVTETNNILKLNCSNKNWVYLDNGNINRLHLNHRGLHLNREGSALLQKKIWLIS